MRTDLYKQNICLGTDSYKIGHYPFYPKNTEKVVSYFEARKGAEYEETLFVGLQALLKTLEGVVVTQDNVEEAAIKMKAHFWGNDKIFNREGWEYIINKCEGKLPIKIRAVPEGSVVPVGNVLFTIENTDTNVPWLTNFLETYLTHVWYSMTVATKSFYTKRDLKKFLEDTSDTQDLLPFMLHDFGYRGATTNEAAGRGGLGHLVNFLGTDTLVAMDYVEKFYNTKYEGIGYSVIATEHSLMTSLGEEGELEIIQNVLNNNPVGIVSVVADSYDYYRFVTDYVGNELKEEIINRHKNSNGIPTKFVVRPDSMTPKHNNPADLVVWTLEQLEKDFGATLNKKYKKVLNPAVGVIWGDGINPIGIRQILNTMQLHGWSAENIVFGMGGGLLQKVNRDTQRCAFKCCAQLRDGEWIEIRKNPLDKTKASKGGILGLYKDESGYQTFNKHKQDLPDQLITVFKNGVITKEWTFDEIRERANQAL